MNDLDAAVRKFDRSGRSKLLSTQRVIFIVVAAAAPLAAAVGNIPLAIARGNGAGAPLAFLLASLTLLAFAIGYGAMAKRIVNTGAFYTYIARGLGKPTGVAAAFIAMMAYTTLTVAMSATTGYFVHLAMAEVGLNIPWVVPALVATALVAALGFRSVDLSAIILGALMALEVCMLVIFDAAVIAQRGWATFTIVAFAPSAAMVPTFAVALMFGYTCFIGFESAALYGEETADPRRSIPRATLIAVLLIGGFYVLTSWIVVGAMGADAAASTAKAEGGQLLFTLVGRFLGPGAAAIMGLLLCTSIVASYLAIHNGATRYLFALSRDRLLPKRFGIFHPKRYAPSNASAAVTVISLGGVLGIASLPGDPYYGANPVLIGLATFGIILLQAFAALAITVEFWRHPQGAGRAALVAPAIGTIGLMVATILVAANFNLLLVGGGAWAKLLPLVYIVPATGGIIYAIWLRTNRSAVYEGLAANEARAEAASTLPQLPVYQGRYCIVGAGPCGLLAARAFKLAGIPYDHFERHTDVGGIWDMANPGTSMYDSAHFISSKYTSGFFGFPMPENYPDYPTRQQIFDYIVAFADRFGLRGAIRFGVGVDQAIPLGEDASEGWDVTLSNGEKHRYRGVVCAVGVTWHPNIPSYPGQDSFMGEVRHTVSFTNADEFRGKRVLVVGGGNSGVDIACEAARSATTARISLRRGYRFVPKHMFGVPTDVFVAAGAPPKGVVIPEDPTELLDAVVGDLTRYGLPAPDHKAFESHPIMNSQILHHLAHGDLQARPGIEAFTSSGVRFVDGREEDFDLVLLATGYEYRVPFLDEALLDWKDGHPQLYLNVFHRTLIGLSMVGFVEFASAGYQRFDEMAQMIAMDAWIEATGNAVDSWRKMKRDHNPNLRGTTTYVDSPRHANYVDVPTYRRVLSEVKQQWQWPAPSNALYAASSEPLSPH